MAVLPERRRGPIAVHTAPMELARCVRVRMESSVRSGMSVAASGRRRGKLRRSDMSGRALDLCRSYGAELGMMGAILAIDMPFLTELGLACGAEKCV